MTKKKKPDDRGFVYSTDPNFQFESSDEQSATLEPKAQVLRIRLETKHRAGKAATIVAGRGLVTPRVCGRWLLVWLFGLARGTCPADRGREAARDR